MSIFVLHYYFGCTFWLGTVNLFFLSCTVNHYFILLGDAKTRTAH